MSRIQVDIDTWLVMREYPQYPKAVITRITDVSGDARFMVSTWDEHPSRRRMTGIYPTLQEADRSVPWPPTTPPVPPNPHASVTDRQAYAKVAGTDSNGHPKRA